MRVHTFSCFMWIIPLICLIAHSTGPSESVWICPDPLQHWLWHNGAEKDIGYTSGQRLSQQQDHMFLLCRCSDTKRTPGKVRKWHFRDCIQYKKWFPNQWKLFPNHVKHDIFLFRSKTGFFMKTRHILLLREIFNYVWIVHWKTLK